MSDKGTTMIEKAEADAFLYREARLADENNYQEWLALWTDDAIYWLPANKDDYDPHRHVSIIYDDRSRLQDRVDRLASGSAWAQEPKSRLRRVISNIEIEAGASSDEVLVRSNFVLGELRRGRQTTYYAAQVHRLRRTPQGIRMAFKKVMLLNNDEPINNLSFLV